MGDDDEAKTRFGGGVVRFGLLALHRGGIEGSELADLTWLADEVVFESLWVDGFSPMYGEPLIRQRADHDV